MDRRDYIDRWLDEWSWANYDLALRPMAVSKRITRIARRLEKVAADALGPLGLDVGEFDVLAALLRAGPPHEVTPTVLNQSLMMSAGGLTKRLGRLEEREMITRRLSPDDRRSLLVTLTDVGKSLAEQAVTAHTKVTAEVIDRIGVDSREQLSDLLRELLLSVDEPGAGSPRPTEHETGEQGEEPVVGRGVE